MSDPQPVPGRRTPPRAEPQQPDRPRGEDREDEQDGDDESGTLAKEREGQQREQTDNAFKNVREGYD